MDTPWHQIECTVKTSMSVQPRQMIVDTIAKISLEALCKVFVKIKITEFSLHDILLSVLYSKTIALIIHLFIGVFVHVGLEK